MINLQGKKIVLVGGAGFIGHHLALKLSELGAVVHIVDSLQVNSLLSFTATVQEPINRSQYFQFVEQRLGLLRDANIQLHIQDARDYHRISHLMSQIEPDAVVLLAAVAHADRSNKDPMSTFDHSLRTLENTLDAVRGRSSHFVYFSSSMVYGNFETEVVTEQSACNPLGIYGALKFAGEKIVIAYNQVLKTPYTIVRPSALYGERCVSRRVSQIFVENVLQGKEVVVKGDGSDRLDFTYVADVVQGVVKILQNERSKNEIFNLTYGKSRSIAELSELLKREFPEIKVNFQARDALMPERGTLCVDKARRLIGYEPQFPLEKGFEKYVAWYRSISHLFSKSTQPKLKIAA